MQETMLNVTKSDVHLLWLLVNCVRQAINFLNAPVCNIFFQVTGTFAPKNFRSRERKYHGMELSFPGAKVPRTFAPRNFRSLAK